MTSLAQSRPESVVDSLARLECAVDRARRVRRNPWWLRWRLGLEGLEERYLLAPVLMAGDSFTFTDSNGDEVTFSLRGKSGTAELFDEFGGDLGNGDDIGVVDVTGASKDLRLIYSVSSVGAEGEILPGDVFMGDVFSDSVIQGIYTIPDTTAGNSFFILGGFFGPGLAKGGTLQADQLGDDFDGKGGPRGGVATCTGGVAIDITGPKGLSFGQALNIRGDVVGHIVIAGDLSGAINIGGSLIGDTCVGGSVLPKGVFGAIAGDVTGDVAIAGDFQGVVTIGGMATGAWDIGGSVIGRGTLVSESWADLEVAGNFNGTLTATSGDANLEVGGDVGGKAVISAEDTLTLDVAGNVLGFARLAADDITGSIDGNSAGHFVAGNDITLEIGGSVLGGSVAADGDVTLDIGGHLMNGIVGAEGVTLEVGGNVVNSRCVASDKMTAIVGGNVVNSQLSASDDLTLEVGGSVVGSQLSSGSEDVTADIGGDLVRSTVFSGESDIKINVGGSIVDSRLDADSVITADVTGDIRGSVFVGDDGITLDVGGSVVASRIAGSDVISAFVGGSVMQSEFVTTDDDLTLEIDGSLISSRLEAADDITLDVDGNVSKSMVIAHEGDLTMSVDGNVDGSTISVEEGDASIEIGGNLNRSTIAAVTGDVTLDVDGSIYHSTVNSFTGDVTVDVEGHVASTTIQGGSDVTVSIDGDLVKSTIQSGDSDVEVDLDGNLVDSVVQAPQGDITIDIGGSVIQTNRKAFSKIVSGDDTVARILGHFNGTILSRRLDLAIGGSVIGSGRSRIQAANILDLDGNGTGFAVARDFNGVLDVTTSFDSGPIGGSTVLVGGVVGSGAQMNFSGTFGGMASAANFEFGDDFLGILNIVPDLVVDLDFAGFVNTVNIGGAVIDATPGDPTITADFLQSLTSSSLFVPTGALTGDFVDGGGVITGTLVTMSGFGTILP